MNKKIKIAIDVSPLYDANSIRGVGYYTKNLVDSIKSEIKTNSEYKNWKIDLITDPNDLRPTIYDLIHYPFFDPFKLTLPPKQEIPTIITIHDLIPRQFKKHFPVGIKGEIKWLIQKLRAKSANFLITISHYSKHVIKDILGYPENKIFVTYLGASSEFKIIKNQKNLESITQKYNLPEKFVLFVGDINWNKNIPGLVNACLSLKYPLVIVGSAATRQNVENHPWNQDLIWLQSQAKKEKGIILTGFVPDNELPSFFNLATIYCQPSFAEGFGLPLVQAMKCGCPVAYSQETCIPEIMDNNGESFDPYSISSIKNSLQKLWLDKNLREKFTQKGLIRAKSFDWRFTAIQTLAVYKLAILNETK